LEVEAEAEVSPLEIMSVGLPETPAQTQLLDDLALDE